MRSSRPLKVSLVGAGNIGGSLAYMLASSGLFQEIMLIDAVDGMPRGKMLDISQSLAVDCVDVSIESSADCAALRGSHAVVVTAGLPRKEGMSREDLLTSNAGIIGGIAKEIGKYAPEAFVIVVTNPLDAMVWHMHRCSGLPAHRVVGMAGILDSARFSFFLAKHMGVSVGSVSSIVLGGHGDLMLPLLRHSTVGGVSVSDLIDAGRISRDDIEKIVERTRKGGEEIVKLLRSGSAYYAPASSCALMLRSYVLNKRMILPCSARLDGEYGFCNGLFAGVPVVIGSGGVEEIIEYPLTQDERDVFSKSLKLISESVDIISG
ncbi:MAG: malate dehydrogenase [Aaplasma endosymbiont of Hyalomma asiaticum]